MARRVAALILLGLAVIVCVVLAASESLTNRTGQTATAVRVTFSEQVRITSHDETIFPTKEPSSRSETFRFSGGQLENGGRFSVSWSPSTAEITGAEWELVAAPAGTFSANLTKTLSLRTASAVSFSPDGRWLAISGTDGGVCLVATQDWVITRFLQTYSFFAGVFSPDSQILAVCESGMSNGPLKVDLWDTASGLKVRTLACDPNPAGAVSTAEVSSMACSPDGVLATASFDGTIRLWDIYTGNALRTITVENYGGLLLIAFSPDGKTLASAGMALHLWDVATGRQLTRADVSASPNCIAVSPDGASLAVGSGWEDDKGQRYTRVELFDFSTGRRFQTLEGPSGIVNGIAFAPDGRGLVSASEDGILTLWTPRPWQQAFAFGEIRHLCVAVSFHPGTRLAPTGPEESPSCADRATTTLLAAGFLDGRVELWSLCQIGN